MITFLLWFLYFDSSSSLWWSQAAADWLQVCSDCRNSAPSSLRLHLCTRLTAPLLLLTLQEKQGNMGKINGCLKCVFIFFNVLFALIGCLMIFGAVKSTATAVQMSTFGGPGVGWIWVTAIGVFGISCLGIYAACSENLIALKIFAGFMGVGMIIMLVIGIVVAVYRNKVKEGIQSASREFAQEYMKNDDFKNLISAIQEPLQCCGLTSAEDWDGNIPDSCECRRTNSCKSKPLAHLGPSRIYSKTCGEILFDTIDLVFKVAMGIYFGFSVTALFGLLFTLLMIRQVSRHDSTEGPSMVMKGY